MTLWGTTAAFRTLSGLIADIIWTTLSLGLATFPVTAFSPYSTGIAAGLSAVLEYYK